MASATIKANGACSGGGHFTLNVTGDATATLNAVSSIEYLAIKARVEALSGRDRVLAIIALHQILNSLTNAQVLTDLQSANGVQVTL